MDFNDSFNRSDQSTSTKGSENNKREEIQPPPHRSNNNKQLDCCINFHGPKSIWTAMVVVTLFGFLFNISRWFEIKLIQKKV